MNKLNYYLKLFPVKSDTFLGRQKGRLFSYFKEI
jgi:hypothetical protein